MWHMCHRVKGVELLFPLFFEHEIVQDEALYKCRLLLFEDPTLEAQPRCVVPEGPQGAFWEVCESASYG